MNFPLIMLILLVITGGIALLDRFVLQRHRAPRSRGALVGGVSEKLFPGHCCRLLSALFPGRTLQDTLGLDDSDSPRRGFHPGE